MWIYIVVREGNIYKENIKTFLNKDKAEAYVKEQKAICPYYDYEIEQHFAI